MSAQTDPSICTICNITFALAEKRIQYGRHFVHEDCDRKARAGRTRERILSLLLSHRDGVHPVLVIPKGGAPYRIEMRQQGNLN